MLFSVDRANKSTLAQGEAANKQKGAGFMLYYSTRKQDYKVGAAEAILRGPAPDGGLFVPAVPAEPFKLEALPAGHYRQIAAAVFEKFRGDYSREDIAQAIAAAYSDTSFAHPDITPLKKLENGQYVLELYHGPTGAFKDIALQILPHLLTSAASKSGESKEIVILTATSGDTGKAALEGFRDVKGTGIVVYFPEKGISAVQKIQMTTQEGNNVTVAAVRGNFDHAQAGVKEIFKNAKIKNKLDGAGYRLSSANSINWGRLLPQIVYYFKAYRALLDDGIIRLGEAVNFAVPTGNFGNILAGFYARQLGLPVNRLICAANRNNVLSDFIKSGSYDSRRELFNSLSPSMDILVSSNLERLLFEISGHDPELINNWMNQLSAEGRYVIDSKTLGKVQELFWSDYTGDEKTLEVIAGTYRDRGYLIDPHTAVGKNVLDRYLAVEKDRHQSIILSTASPFKFTKTTIRALFGKNAYRDLNELELIKILADKTGTRSPAFLTGLDQRPALHRQVIEPADMPGHLLELLNLG